MLSMSKKYTFICEIYDSVGEGDGTPLQYSCLENPMDGGAWWAAGHGVAKSQARLSDFTFSFHFSLSCIGEGNGNPLQCSCLESPRDRGAWWAAFYGVAQNQTQLKRLSSSSSSMTAAAEVRTAFRKWCWAESDKMGRLGWGAEVMVTHKLEGRGMQDVIKIGGSWFASFSSTQDA